MAFTKQELEWAAYSGVASADLYDDVREVVPFDDFGGLAAALCMFNPIREVGTGRIVPWASLEAGSTRQQLVHQAVRQASGIDRTWKGRLIGPLLGAPDPLCWTILSESLPHVPVKAALFPMSEVNELELDWEQLSDRLSTNGYDTPVLWWDTNRTFVVASPYESVLTYVCGSIALIEQIGQRREIETRRLI